MYLWAAVMVGLAVSMDGFMVGLAYGIKKIKIPLVSMLIITMASVTAVSLSMFFGKALTMVLSAENAVYLGSILLIVLGAYFLLSGLREKIESIEVDHEEPLLTLSIKFLGIMIQILKEPARADFDESGEIGSREALFLGMALSMDAFGAGVGLALTGLNIFHTPFAWVCKFILVIWDFAGRSLPEKALSPLLLLFRINSCWNRTNKFSVKSGADNEDYWNNRRYCKRQEYRGRCIAEFGSSSYPRRRYRS